MDEGEMAAAGLGVAALALGVTAKVLLKKEALVGADPLVVALGFAAAAAPVLVPVWWLVTGRPAVPLTAAPAAAPLAPGTYPLVPPAAWGMGLGWCVANLAGALFRQRAYRVAPMGAVGVFTTTAGAAAGAFLLLLRGGGRPVPALACLVLVAVMALVLLPRRGSVGPGSGPSGWAADAGVGRAGSAPGGWAADAMAAWAAYGVAAALAGVAGGATVVAGATIALVLWFTWQGWSRLLSPACAGTGVGRGGQRASVTGLTPRTAAAGVLEGVAWLAYAQALVLAPLVAGSINAFQGLAVVAGGRAALGERVTLRLAVAASLGLGAVALGMLAG